MVKHKAMKTSKGRKVEICAFLTSLLEAGKWQASRFCCFTPGDLIPVFWNQIINTWSVNLAISSPVSIVVPENIDVLQWIFLIL